LGSAYALDRLVRNDGGSIAYRPVARLREGRLLRGLASSCMDTSDGLITTLDELVRRNRCGFAVSAPIERILHPDAWGAAEAAGLSPRLMLAGPHGEFELVFTVPPDRCAALLDGAAAEGWVPVALGLVTAEPGIVRLGSDPAPLDTTRIRNLFDEVGGDVQVFLRAVERLTVGG
jgi:thiamine-monophosphate kinase